jgi:hypothetical protein
VFRRPDFTQVSVQLEEYILGNLFCQPAVACHPQGERKHHGLVLVHEMFEIRQPFMHHGFRFYSLIRTGVRQGMQSFTRTRDKSSSVGPENCLA